MLNCPASPETLAGTGAAAKHAVIDFLDAAGYDASTWTHSVMAGTCKATPPPTPTVPADPSSTHGWPAPSGSPRSSPRRSATTTCELWLLKPRAGLTSAIPAQIVHLRCITPTPNSSYEH